MGVNIVTRCIPTIIWVRNSFDTRENVDSLYANAKESAVDYVLPGVLYLRGKTRKVFFDFIQSEFSALFTPLQELYKTGGTSKDYKNELYKMVNERKEYYGLSGSYSKPMKEKLQQNEYQQMSLFDQE